MSKKSGSTPNAEFSPWRSAQGGWKEPTTDGFLSVLLQDGQRGVAGPDLSQKKLGQKKTSPDQRATGEENNDLPIGIRKSFFAYSVSDAAELCSEPETRGLFSCSERLIAS